MDIRAQPSILSPATVKTIKMDSTVVNLIKHFSLIIYDPRVVLTTNLPILRR